MTKNLIASIQRFSNGGSNAPYTLLHPGACELNGKGLDCQNHTNCMGNAHLSLFEAINSFDLTTGTVLRSSNQAP
jgi:hypothetical protein